MAHACPTCHAVFNTNSKRGVVRCPTCGALGCTEVTVHALTPGERVRRSGTAIIVEPRLSENLQCMFRCVTCTKSFELVYRPNDTPACPHCKGTELVALTPAASFTNDRAKVITDKRTVRRLRFIKKGWENLVHFRSALDGLVQLARRIEVPSADVDALERAGAKAVEALDRQHGQRLQEYMRISGHEAARKKVLSKKGKTCRN